MNPHLRMEKILAIIEANPGITGQNIAGICAVPWSTIKQDLETMLLDTENPVPLYTDADDDTFEDDSELNTELTRPKSPASIGGGCQRAVKSSMDSTNIQWGLNPPLNEVSFNITPQTKWFLETHARKHAPLHLTVGEALHVLDLAHVDARHPKLLSFKQKVAASLGLDMQGTYRYVKGDMAPVACVDHEVLAVLEQAIAKQRQISFTYRSHPATAGPLGLVYYSRLRQWYLVALADGIYKTFNLSKMQGIKELAKTFSSPPDFSLRDWLAPRWGMEFGEPVRVKVRFMKRSQTFEKVRKDVAHRRCVLTEENGGETLLYEDTIIGKNEFVAWLLGFGSTAEVLEPLELRHEIIARVKAALANYK